MKLLVAIPFLFLASILSAASPELTLGHDGSTIPLSTDDTKRLVQKIENLVASANFNSRDHPAILRDTTYWRPISSVRRGSYLHLAYARPHLFQTVGGKIPARSVWIDLHPTPTSSNHALYPGPITLTNGRKKTLLTMESGYLLIELGLDPAIYPHLPDRIRQNMDRCRNLVKHTTRSP